MSVETQLIELPKLMRRSKSSHFYWLGYVGMVESHNKISYTQGQNCRNILIQLMSNHYEDR